MNNDDKRSDRSNPVQLELFDPAALRLSQDFTGEVGLTKKLTTVPVRKPNRQEFIRVRPGAECRLNTLVLEMREDNELYLVEPAVWRELPGEIVPKALFTSINTQGVLFLWSIRLPAEDGRLDDWNRSALAAAELAETRWVRVIANRGLGAYEVLEPTGGIADPVWPDVPFQEILAIAFKNRFVRDLDHPAIRRLRGQG